MLLALAIAAFIAAAIPAGIFLANLRLYTSPPTFESGPLPKISILIPARNEEPTIAACIQSAIASTGASIEVIVMDDSSTDRTATIVQDLIARQPPSAPSTLHFESAPPLPPGWNGKQHTC